MLRINANKVALLAAAFFITKYNEMLPSFGRYTLDYQFSIFGVDANIEIVANWSAELGKITDFKFDITDCNHEVEITLDGHVDTARELALNAVNQYVTIDSSYLLVL